MRIPLFLKWFGHILREVWDDTSADTKVILALGWLIISFVDIFMLLFCMNQWTRELGYGWTQGAYNWGMAFFWFTGFPFLILLSAWLIRAIYRLYKSARTSYSDYKRDNT